MPLLKVQTNNDVDNAQQDRLLGLLSALTARELGKPEQYVMVILETGTPMMFAGNDAPAMYLELKSIGLPEQQTGALSRNLSQAVHEETGIPVERIYIEFTNAPRHLWGWNGATF